MKKPKAIDLYCGLGGWAEGLLAEGYEVTGYDIEAHDYGTGGYPGTLVLRDVTTIHGSEFKDAALIVCSPPCQRYSYMAMPWSRAKAQAAMIEADTTGDELRKLNLLFDTCFRIQREASEAAGHHISMVVENVRGAQKWVGRAAWHYGSYFLWGDVPALMPMTISAQKFNPDGSSNCSGSWFAIADSKERGAHQKAPGKNWNEWKDWDGTEENRPASLRPWGDEVKTVGHANVRDGHSHTRHITNQRESEGVKQAGISGPRENGKGDAWFQDGAAKHGSKSNSRKAASAMIAKIPYPLAQHIARAYLPKELL